MTILNPDIKEIRKQLAKYPEAIGQLEALQECITTRWIPFSKGTEDGGTPHCQLCETEGFRKNDGGCEGCVINRAICDDDKGCYSTPFNSWCLAKNIDERMRAAKSMLGLLRRIEAVLVEMDEDTIPNVLTKGAPQLFAISAEVPSGEDISKLISKMWGAMYVNSGIGLAACQIGAMKRVIVIHADGFKKVLINPVISKSHGGKIKVEEGCLSFPGEKVEVLRAKRVQIQAYDKNWKQVTFNLRGLAARCAQHEIDHLDGIVMGDRE